MTIKDCACKSVCVTCSQYNHRVKVQTLRNTCGDIHLQVEDIYCIYA